MKIENSKIFIKKRSLPEVLTYIIFLMPFFLSFFLEFLKLPSLIKYFIDLCWLGVLILLILVKRVYFKKDIAPAVFIVLTFFVTALIVYLFNFQSPFYFFWGLRNNLRFYVAFLAFTVYFKEDDINSMIKFLDITFWVNAVVAFLQYFVGFKQDNLGGIFGVEKGCNAYMIIFLAIITIKSVLNFFNDKESGISCFTKCGIALLISVMAELKFFFVMFMLILIVASVITKFSWKKVVLYIISFFFLMVASVLIVEIFGENMSIDFENLLKLVFSSNYSSSRDLGRFTAIPTISNRFLIEPLQKLFGFGLGNCDTSAFDFCNTPFYRSYSYLNYNWFSSAFLFLETGYVGLTLYLLFFVAIFIISYRKLKQDNSNKLFCQMGMIMSIVCFILTFYNSSLRMETGYIAFFILALPFVDSGINEPQELNNKQINSITGGNDCD